MFQKLFASRLLRFGVAVAVLFAVVFSFPTTRVWAGQFLGLFRVEQVTVISIDPSGLEQLNGNTTFTKQMSQLMSKSVTVTKKPADPKDVANVDEASQAAGFTVRLPKDAPSAPRLSVQDSAAFNFKVDRARAQAVLDEAGRKDLVLPDSIDGADISVEIPASVQAAYGKCPEINKENAEGMAGGSMGRRYPECIMLTQMPSPTVNTPPDVDIQQLAEMALEFTGMTREEAQSFSKSVDWTTSLVIPIPRNAATYKQVMVDGVTGTLIQRPADDAPQFVLIWVKDGVVYSIGGWGDRAEQAIQLANTLQ